MRKLKLLIVVLLLCFLLSAPFISASYPTTIKKAVIASSLDTQSDLDFVKTHFDLCVLSFGKGSQVTSLKSGGVTVLGYKNFIFEANLAQYDMTDYSTVIANPTWILHDNLGNAIWSNYWNAYVMDITNTGWLNHLIAWINTEVTNNNYDGVFLDDVWNDMLPYSQGFNTTLPLGYYENFKTYVASALAHIKSGISATVLVNSDEFSTDTYINAVDGQCLEGFIHPTWMLASASGGDYYALGDELARKSALGKIVLAWSGSLDYSAGVVSNCYNAFKGNSSDLSVSYFAYNNYWNSDGYKGFYSIMDSVIATGATPTPSPQPTTAPTNTPIPTSTPIYFPPVTPTATPTPTPALEIEGFDFSFLTASNLLTYFEYVIVAGGLILFLAIVIAAKHKRDGGK